MMDSGNDWAKRQELYERDYKTGYAAFLDGDTDAHSDSAAWKQGWEDARAEHESGRRA